jgi:hypothetical protein
MDTSTTLRRLYIARYTIGMVTFVLALIAFVRVPLESPYLSWSFLLAIAGILTAGRAVVAEQSLDDPLSTSPQAIAADEMPKRGQVLIIVITFGIVWTGMLCVILLSTKHPHLDPHQIISFFSSATP